jgi:hypothetical protein
MDETGLGHITIGVGVSTIFFSMTPMVTEGAALEQLAAVGEVAALIAPLAAVRYPPIVGDPSLPNESLTFQNLHGRQPAGATIRKDEGVLDGAAKSSVSIGSCDPS